MNRESVVVIRHNFYLKLLSLLLTLMYAQEIGNIADDPKGAALTEPKLCAASPKSANGSTTGCDGKKGAR